MLAGERRQQSQRHGPRHDGDRLEEPSGIGVEASGPCQHGVADRCRHLGALVGQDLGEEEGVAARAPMQLVGVDPPFAC